MNCRQTWLLVLSVAAALFFETVLSACPFCLAPPQTWSETLDNADIVLVAEVVEVRCFEQQIKADVSCETVFRVQQVLKCPGLERYCCMTIRGLACALPGQNQSSEPSPAHGRSSPQNMLPVRPGMLITIQENLTAKPGDQFLLSGRRSEPLPNKQILTYQDDEDSSADPSVTATPDPEQDSPASAVVHAISTTIGTAESSADPEQQRPLFDWMLPALTDWDSPAELSPELLDYLVNAPSEELPGRMRLPYYVAFLETQNSEIAGDAWSEFARSTYADVRACRRLYSPDELKKWIASQETSPERLGLYGMMLGLCGDADDAQFLKQQIGEARAISDYRFGSEGLMGGYLLLTGTEGLTFLEDTRLKNKHVRSDEIFSLIQAVQFVWTYEPDCISRSQLRSAMHQLLSHEQFREIAISNLSRWKDWETAPRLITLFDTLEGSDRRSQEAILTFMLAMSRDRSVERPQDHLMVQVTAFLQDVESRHPKLLRAAYQELGMAPEKSFGEKGSGLN